MSHWAGVFAGSGAAFITGVFATFANKWHKENVSQRRISWEFLENISRRIEEVRTDVKEVRRRQDDHLEWHAEQ